MKMKWAAEPLRSILGRDEPAPTPAPDERSDDAHGHDGKRSGEHLAQHTWFNALVVGGPVAAVDSLHQSLTHTQPLPWRAAEDVEREVVHLAMLRSGRRIEMLTLEDVLQACEDVEARHLIDNATIERHFRNLWHTSAAYCKQYMRGLLARKPGDAAGPTRTAAAPSGMFREGFSLTRVILPPFRILQGSYRYAGRTWCQRSWGTPEDARLLHTRTEALVGGQKLVTYEFETLESAPIGALQRLVERHCGMVFCCVAADGDSGQRLRLAGGRGQAAAVHALSAIALTNGMLSIAAQREVAQMAHDNVLSHLIGSPSLSAQAAPVLRQAVG